MAQGRFWSRVSHLSDVLFRILVGLTAGANRMVFGSSVYQPSTRTSRTWAHVADSRRVVVLPPAAGAAQTTSSRSAEDRLLAVGCKGRMKPIEEGNLRCLQPSACLVEIEPLDAVNLGECLDDA